MSRIDNSGFRGKTVASQAEVQFSTADNAASRRMRREAAAGRLRKLYAGVYTSNLKSRPVDVVRRNWLAIVGHLLPDGVVSHRSAIEGGPSANHLVLTRGKTRREIALPGLTVHVVPGAPAITAGIAPDMPLGHLFLSSEIRRYLENLTRGRGWKDKVVQNSTLESLLDKTLTLKGPAQLNQIRDAAHDLATTLGLATECDRLATLIGALLGTHQARHLHSRQALARAAGRPYDPDRLPVFDALFSALSQTVLASVPDPAAGGRAMENFAFFESYFSNYIEGTTFTVDEAEEIVFHGRIIENRTEDSHDILGTFRAAIQTPWRDGTPMNVEDFLRQLRELNALVMQSRPDKSPGQWKIKANQAGSTFFVEPTLVPGTLTEGFQRVGALADPIARALMTMLVVTEVHPFADGNGRTARLAMNAVLTAARSCRIIVPTVYRENYLMPLKALSNNRDADGYIRAMAGAQAWSAAFDYEIPRAELEAAMAESNAFREERDGFKLVIPKR